MVYVIWKSVSTSNCWRIWSPHPRRGQNVFIFIHNFFGKNCSNNRLAPPPYGWAPPPPWSILDPPLQTMYIWFARRVTRAMYTRRHKSVPIIYFRLYGRTFRVDVIQSVSQRTKIFKISYILSFTFSNSNRIVQVTELLSTCSDSQDGRGRARMVLPLVQHLTTRWCWVGEIPLLWTRDSSPAGRSVPILVFMTFCLHKQKQIVKITSS